MSNKTLIIIVILIVVGLELFAGGYFCGVLYQKKNKPQDLFSYLGSLKIISSFVITGEVTEISGRTVTLSNGTENFSFNIKEDMQYIYLFASGNQAVSSFEAIKVGDNLSVNARVSSDGQLEILAVIIKPF